MTAEDRWAEAWRHRERLLRIARRRLPTYEDAEDVVAEAIQRAGVQEDLAVSAVPAWITRVTVNLCVDRQRRLKTQRALLQRAELRPEALPSHEDDVVRRAEASWVASEVEALPARQALALHLRAQGLDNTRIADHLDVTVATVEGLVKRSRIALRQALRSAGAAVGAAWALVWSGRRPAAVVAVCSAVLLVVLPWVGDPVVPTPPDGRGPGLSAAPPAAARFTEAAAQTQLSDFAGGLLTGAAPAPEARAGVDPLLGVTPPYDGPRCVALYCLPIVDEAVDKTLGARSPQGWSPADLWDYLDEPARSENAAARRPLVAIVSWYDFPWVAEDLAVYRRTFRLPACGAEDGCLQIVHGTAAGSVDDLTLGPALGVGYAAGTRSAGHSYGANYAAEQAQMLQGVSASCPECRLALVIASSDHGPNIAQAMELAKALDPEIVITTLTVLPDTDGSDDRLEDPSLYDDGPLFAVGGGVGGYHAGNGAAPRRFPNVVSVGGTVIGQGRVLADENNSSFCNSSQPQPSWQQDLDTGCPGRAGIDLVLPTGPDNGLAVYISGGLIDDRGWYHPGRAAQAVAIFGGIFARHNLATIVRGPADLYANPEWFTDIVLGDTDCLRQSCSNDPDLTGCRPSAPQICNARLGWDGATGLGEPRNLPWP